MTKSAAETVYDEVIRVKAINAELVAALELVDGLLTTTSGPNIKWELVHTAIKEAIAQNG